ncbi:MAG: hypothetical protein ACXADC_11225 [Candidatus Thorarchaeota archaeon]
MPHKKGRRGQKKTRVREVGGLRYPRKMERCTVREAPNCKGWVNSNTMPAPGICKRCWQSINSSD